MYKSKPDRRCGTCKYMFQIGSPPVCTWMPDEPAPTWLMDHDQLVGDDDGRDCRAWLKREKP